MTGATRRTLGTSVPVETACLAIGEEIADRLRDRLKDTLVWNIERGWRCPVPRSLVPSQLRGQVYRRAHQFFRTYDVLCAAAAQVPFNVELEWVNG